MRDKFSLAIKNSEKKTIIHYFTPLEMYEVYLKQSI